MRQKTLKKLTEDEAWYQMNELCKESMKHAFTTIDQNGYQHKINIIAHDQMIFDNRPAIVVYWIYVIVVE